MSAANKGMEIIERKLSKKVVIVEENQENVKESKEECLVWLKKLLKDDLKLKHLKGDDAYLTRFLLAVDLDVEEAFKRIKQFYDTLETLPNWFPKHTLIDKKWVIETNCRMLLKEKDKEGRPIYIYKLGLVDPSKMDLIEDLVAIDDCYVEGMFLENPGIEQGMCVIIDVANFPYKVTKWATPYNISSCLKRIYSMPVRDYRYHIVNSSIWVNLLIKIIWPFLPQYVKEQVKFHFNDYNSLYQYVDQNVLPEEYGGSLKIEPDELNKTFLSYNSKIMDNFKLHRYQYLDNLKEEIVPSNN
ncbi:unnamed protein product [Diabrotica balteata]|uniref:CRAL-TRIO domain-containing protein n=1 Tax=Diabrotica balteata TaxID=107213 RepID=A0A9N9SZK7_DIABA|nr:unnamed protein product [Diabrotica balteata]